MNTQRTLGAEETYSHLGSGPQRMQDTELGNKYRNQLKKIWPSELIGRHKFTATNMMAVPALLYSLGVVEWMKEEL